MPKFLLESTVPSLSASRMAMALMKNNLKKIKQNISKRKCKGAASVVNAIKGWVAHPIGFPIKDVRASTRSLLASM
jgi:hypothetical protein